MDLDAGSAICLLILVLETLFGIGSSFFIMITTLGDIVKGKTPKTLYKIMCALSFSNICSSAVLSCNIFTDIFGFTLNTSQTIIIFILNVYRVTSCSWMLSCLCFFYSIKIIQIQSRIFSLLKRKIDVIIPRMILIMQAVSFCGSFIFVSMDIFYILNVSSDFASSNMTENSNHQTIFVDIYFFTQFVSFGAGTMITAFTTLSLLLHIHKMSRTIGSSNSAKAKEGVKTLVCLLIFYLFYFSLLFIERYSLLLFSYYFLNLVDLIAKSAFAPVLNILLIQSNPKYNYIFNTMNLCCRVGEQQR